MNSHYRLFPLFFLALLPLFVASTCHERTLDPAGAYASDELLYEIDGVIVEVAKTFQSVIDLADRNAAFVASKPEVAEAVAKIRAELDGTPQPTETLVKLFAVRDAYKLARTTTNREAVRAELITARTFLGTARSLLPLLSQP